MKSNTKKNAIYIFIQSEILSVLLTTKKKDLKRIEEI